MMYSRDELGDEKRKPFVQALPLNWEQGLTDHVSLIWTPIPVQLKWQYWRTQDAYLGFYVNLLGRTWSRVKDFDWSPILSTTLRKKLSKRFATELSVSAEVDFKLKQTANWTLGSQVGILYQVADTWMTAFHLDILAEKGSPRSRYLGTLPFERSDGVHYLYPLNFSVVGSLTEQWELDATCRYIALPSLHYRSYEVFLSLLYYW